MRTSVPAILVAVVGGMAALAAAELLFQQVLAQVLVLVLSMLVVMAVGVALRPERRIPLLCDPFVMCCAFLAQFYVIGPIVMAIWGLSPIYFFRARDISAALA